MVGIVVRIIVVKGKEFLRFRRFLALHIDIGLGSLVRCSVEVVVTVAGYAAASKFDRALVVINADSGRR